MGVYYLSDRSFDALDALRRNDPRLTVGTVIEHDVGDGWLDPLKVDLPGHVQGIIKRRAEEVERRSSKSAVARGDKRRRTVGAEGLYDGVVYRVVFGSAGRRRARQFAVSGDVEKRLAQWLKSTGVVRRRAASQRTLAGCALELIGRGWVK